MIVRYSPTDALIGELLIADFPETVPLPKTRLSQKPRESRPEPGYTRGSREI